jgi:hypothetical protein
MANESEFTAHETSFSFPADDINMQRHIQIATVQNCPNDKIVTITESCQKCKQLAPTENCIFFQSVARQIAEILRPKLKQYSSTQRGSNSSIWTLRF